MKILLDTNFLLVPVQFKVNIYELLEGDLITLDACIRELEKLARSKGKDGANAKVALKLAKNVKIIRAKSIRADVAIINYAKSHGCAVATNDRKLIKTLKSKGIKIIRLRQMKLLAEE